MYNETITYIIITYTLWLLKIQAIIQTDFEFNLTRFKRYLIVSRIEFSAHLAECRIAAERPRRRVQMLLLNYETVSGYMETRKGNCFSLLSIRPAIVNHPVNHLSEDESGIYPLSKNHSPFKISDISGKKFDLETLSLFSNDSSFISSTSSFSSHSNFILFLVGFFSIPSPLYLKFLPFPLDFYPLPE